MTRDDLLAELRRRLAALEHAPPMGLFGRLPEPPERLAPSCEPSEPIDAPPHGAEDLCAALDAAGADLSRACVVDTETTGLATGTGTLAFLIGVGRWEGGALRVEQLLLERPSAEPEVLARLDALLEGAGALVTFNGRTFDLPLLRTRYRMNRMSPRALELPHLDLLPPARRLFGGRVADCRLQTLERLVLGRRRPLGDDVPGADIPLRYQSYLRSGKRQALEAVLLHNRRDVASTAALLGEVVRRLGDPLRYAEDGWELLAAGELWARAGDLARADAALEQGLGISRSVPARRRLLRLRARLARRGGRHELARRLWERYRDEFPEENLGHIEAAKLYEHRFGDLDAACRAARAAPQKSEAVERRIGRLLRRMLVTLRAGGQRADRAVP